MGLCRDESLPRHLGVVLLQLEPSMLPAVSGPERFTTTQLFGVVSVRHIAQLPLLGELTFVELIAIVASTIQTTLFSGQP